MFIVNIIKKYPKTNYHEIATSQIQFHRIFNSLHLGFETTSSKNSRLFSLDICKKDLIKSHFINILKLNKRSGEKIFIEDLIIVLGYLNVFLLTIHI